MQDAFGDMGIRFTALNYAMKFLSSADEIALCQDVIYPASDIMFWDFDMTDEKDYWKLAMFGHRLARNSTTALIAFARTKPHTKVLKGFEMNGMTVLGKDWRVQQRQANVFPDSAALSKEDRAALPEQLQYIRCGNEIEDGGPQIMHTGILRKLCRAYKFNVTVCGDRPHKYIWHPSFRTNAIKGYTLAMTLFELTEDAIEQLPDEATQQQLQEELDRLKEAERTDYQGMNTDPSYSLEEWYEKENERHGEIPMMPLFQAPALCRTALLPSKSRYHYQLQGDGTKITTLYNNTYEKGTILGKLQREDSKTKGGFKYPEPERQDDMVVVTDRSGYYDCKEEPLVVDHQDAFFVSSKMGWKSLTIPNERERPLFDMAKHKGWVFICLNICDNSKCLDEDLHDRVLNKRVRPDQGDPNMMIEEFGRVEMELNGIPVIDQDPLFEEKTSHLDTCVVLKREADSKAHTWTPREDGTYQLRVRVVGGTEYSYVKITSIIIM